ncbi:hypothetical protein M569_00612 [Genlisea aurea]|uniref:Myb-like domain-containing protein n=1 Tax=Genlisea aurea TaxID=192259 RepID=S8EDU4_9LAMI|nr:hypothetical protein M569_00612 [Genlisea aurea]
MDASSNGVSPWSSEENKRFETALIWFEGCADGDRWQRLADAVGGGKTIEQVKKHYEDLMEDLRRIDLGEIPFPDYPDDTDSSDDQDNDG